MNVRGNFNTVPGSSDSQLNQRLNLLPNPQLLRANSISLLAGAYQYVEDNCVFDHHRIHMG